MKQNAMKHSWREVPQTTTLHIRSALNSISYFDVLCAYITTNQSHHMIHHIQHISHLKISHRAVVKESK